MSGYKKNINIDLILKLCSFFICFFVFPVFIYGDTNKTLDLVTYYPSPNIDARNFTVSQDMKVALGIAIVNDGNFIVGSDVFKVDNNGLNCTGGVTYGQETFNYPASPTGTQGSFVVPDFTLTQFPLGENPYIELNGIALTAMPTIVNTDDSHINYTATGIVADYEAQQDALAPDMAGLGSINGDTGLRGQAKEAFDSVTYIHAGKTLSRRKGLSQITKTGSNITAAIGLCIQGGGFGVGGGAALDRISAIFTGVYKTFEYELK